jgi:hypothetical protein
MAYKFSNRLSALITVAVTTTALTVQLEAGAGAKFPALSTNDVCQCTMVAATGVVEIVEVTGVTGDVVTVRRAQEGTAASSFPVGSRFEMRVTTRVLDNFLQRTGGTMTGPLNMNNKELQNAKYPENVFMDIIHGRFIRARDVTVGSAVGENENAIYIPPDNGIPQIAFSPILTAELLRSCIFPWAGDVNNVPSHFHLCDGTNGTPDMRNLFIKGWGDQGVFGSGGAKTRTTNPAGGHDHGGSATPRVLDASNLPSLQVNTTEFPVTTGGGGNPRLTSVSVSYASGENRAHNHPIPAVGNHQHTVDVEPQYYVLAYVILAI